VVPGKGSAALQRGVEAVFQLTEPASQLADTSFSHSFVSGHDFSSADKHFIFEVPSGLQSARNLPFGLFQRLVSRAVSGIHDVGL